MIMPSSSGSPTRPSKYCHRLHYLQMVAEKLAKSMLTPPGSREAPPSSHSAFVRMLQVLKTRPEVRRQLGFEEAAQFKRYIDSLLALAARIEGLAPAQAGLIRPNPEYPWRDPPTGQIHAPARFDFPEFDPRDARLIKLHGLIRDLLRIAR
ncbi:MAG: hypothetical protein AMXMBFR83_31490 [Phycisphaerae bacterium]